MRQSCSIVTFAVAAFVAVAAQAPPPPVPLPRPGGAVAAVASGATVAISGAVVDASTGAPIPGAVVEISVDGRPVRTDAGRARTSDGRGRFVFTELPVGSVAVRAAAIGYLSSGFAEEEWSRVDRLTARAGDWIADVRMALARPGVIAGTVLDERGQAVVGVIVGVMERIRVAGTERHMAGRAAVTDDRGRFRIIDLTPGDYVVQVPGTRPAIAASPDPFPWPGTYPPPPPNSAGRAFTYPSVFYPGTTAVSRAQVVPLRAGETREGVDVTLEPVRAARVTGLVEGAPTWASGIALRLVPSGSGESVGAELLTQADAGGRFVFERVPEGTYTLVGARQWAGFNRGVRLGEPSLDRPGGANSGRSTEDLESGPSGLQLQTTWTSGSQAFIVHQPITVISPETVGVVAISRALGTFRGRVTREIDRRFPVPDLYPSGGLRLDAADGWPEFGLPRSDARPDDPVETFSIGDVYPGRFYLRASFGWLIKSVTWNGRDYSHAAFDTVDSTAFDNVQVIVTNAGASVSGIVRGPAGPTDGVAVLLFPVDQDQWTDFGLFPVSVRRASTAGHGRFTITSLPAGDYYAVAVPGSAIELDEATFRRLRPAAVTISLAWGESRAIDLTEVGGQP